MSLSALKRFDVEIVSTSGSPPNQKALIRRPEELVGGAPGRPQYPVIGSVSAGQRAWCLMDGHGAVVVAAPLASPSLDGFMSSSDKSKLDRALDVESSQRVVYVSPTGSDTTGDGTSTNRWRTIQHAVNQARAIMQPVNGTSSYKIVCATGTYDERVTIPANLLSSFGFFGRGGIWITSESQVNSDVLITSTNGESTLSVFGSCCLDRVTIENDNIGVLVRGNVDTHCFITNCVIRRRTVADGGSAAIYAQTGTRVHSQVNATITGRRFVYGLRAEQGAIISREGSQPSGTTNNEFSIWGGQVLPTRNLVTLGADVVNNNAVANTFQDVTGLSFSVSAGVLYKFVAMIAYDAAATTTGSRWSVNGPSSPTRLFYIAEWTLTASSTFRSIQSTYDAGTVQATSILSGNLCRIEGIIQPSASGTFVIRFASEVANSAITAKAGSTLEWWQVQMEFFYKDVMVVLGGVGTVLSAVLLWLFAKVMSRTQHDEIVNLIQSANERFVSELREAHREEVGDLRERLKILSDKSDLLSQRNEELCDKLLAVTQENGQLKLEVAVLRKEVEMLRGSSRDDPGPGRVGTQSKRKRG